jgi:prepilin-type N-terminal cleavage/methylation domain-containing protein
MRSGCNDSGFTLIELLLSVSVIAILSTLSLPFISAFQVRNNLDVAVNTIAQGVRRAQTLATAAESDASCSAWGLYVQNTGIVIYCGANYSSRVVGYDEFYEVASNITVANTGNANDVSFSKVFGVPNNPGTITLTEGNDSRMVTINGKGIVSY